MFIFKLIRYGVIRDKLNAFGFVGFRLNVLSTRHMSRIEKSNNKRDHNMSCRAQEYLIWIFVLRQNIFLNIYLPVNIIIICKKKS